MKQFEMTVEEIYKDDLFNKILEDQIEKIKKSRSPILKPGERPLRLPIDTIIEAGNFNAQYLKDSFLLIVHEKGDFSVAIRNTIGNLIQPILNRVVQQKAAQNLFTFICDKQGRTYFLPVKLIDEFKESKELEKFAEYLCNSPYTYLFPMGVCPIIWPRKEETQKEAES